MPRGKVRDWKGKIGLVVSETGVQHLFLAADLVGTLPEEISDGLIVEFEGIKAGSGWQAKKIRKSPDQSWGGKAAQVKAEAARAAALVLPPEILRVIPVPDVVRKTVVRVALAERHPGLFLDKYLTPCTDREHDAQKEQLQRIAELPGGSPTFDEIRTRHADLLTGLKAVTWTRTTTAPMALHGATVSALANIGLAGICLHPIHGFAYLPGSGIKGLARAHALRAYPEKADLIDRIFGHDRSEKYSARHHAGAVVFHEAIPEKWPRLIVDIINNHHTEYYQGTSAPGDWMDPIPTYFLALAPGATFTFGLSARRAEDAELLSTARQWLDEALSHRGAGAKVNAGYGFFAPVASATPASSRGRTATFEATLTLTTPAFLAGALQRQADCDLRSAGLRGLLRWWWRTLHSGFVDIPTLRKMESFLWGDTAASGAIQTRIERIPSKLQPIECPYKEINPQNGQLRFSRKFREDHGIWEAPQGRTQGLSYAGYGMDEKVGQNRKRRWVAPAGMSWRVTLVAHEKKHPDGRLISAEAILKQAKAALWWWAFLGGAGGRSRKGFGSFADPPELKDFEGGRWLSLGKEFRKEYGLADRDFDAAWAESPAIYLMRDLAKSLNQNPWLEVATAWTDPWRVLHEIGMAMQSFAQDSPDTGHGKHCDAKRYLGLPRKLHGPRDQPMSHQNYHRPPIDLTALENRQRHASPIFYHVAGTPGQRLTIRVAAFPTAMLRPEGMFEEIGLEECTGLHRELLQELAHYLGQRKDAR